MKIMTAVLTMVLSVFADQGTAAAQANDHWRFEVAPYIWATGLNGDATAGGTTTSVDSDFSDIVSGSDSLIGLMLHTEVGRGRWSGYVDVTFANVGVEDIATSIGAIDVTSTTLWLEIAGTYRFVDNQRIGPPSHSTTWTLDGVLGARVTSIGLELDVPPPSSGVDEDKTWAEPFIGARGRFALSERWLLQVYGDIGGFSIGSDFAWQVNGLVGYRFHIGNRPTTAFAGYRALSQDYGSDGFEWDVMAHGPLIGMSFSF